QVELPAATKRGIPVFNAPYSNTRSVAELVLAEAIMLFRGIPEKSTLAHQGGWKKSAANAHEVRGKKLGIIGYGNIGSQLSIMAESLGMEVYFYDVVTKLSMGNAVQVSDLNTLLSMCDIISLHVPENKNTQWMFSEAQFEAMKNNSILINASRGTVVVIEALAEYLKNGKLLGAAIDVFPEEPRGNDDEFLSPLRGINNVILTPHIGGSTQEAQENIGREVAEKFIMYSDIGTSLSSVNFPEVSLPAHKGKHRLLHIHQNIPGVLGKINQILSKNNVNISAQYLQTNASIGYVVIDVDAKHSEIAMQKIRQIEGTIRCRVLY
ncbi:MAG: phosphoglycerate dehydrogenase, partial [Endozoicomonas sp.]